MKKKTRVLVAVVTAVVLLFSTAGVAVAAGGSVPGDPMYGIDRALEKVGVGAGGAQERLAEAGVLADRGDVEEALAHATDALVEEGETDEDAREAAEALLAAADAVMSGGDEESAAVRERVAEMLRWMATTEARNREFGRGVSERARGIVPGEDEVAIPDAPEDESGDAPAGPPAGTPAGPPEGAPAGPPEGASAGPPEGAGRP